MELAKITSKGQITLPINMRRNLKLSEGGKIAFVKKGGYYVVMNPTTMAFGTARDAFSNGSGRMGLQSVDDVASMMEEARAGQGRKSKMSRKEAFGCMRGQFKMSEDFNAPLEDFKEYMG